MAKKKKKTPETTIEDFYDLKTEQMDELVAALQGEAPEDENELISYSVEECVGTEAAQYGEETEYGGKKKKKKGKEFNPYKLDRLSRVPTWIKAFVIKYWFAGMVIFIVSFGLSYYLSSEDQVTVTGLVLGVVVDFLVNPAMRYFESDAKEYNAYMMFPFALKKFWTLFTNIIYYIIVAYAVSWVYAFINIYIVSVGVEPLLGGLLYLLVDMAFIGIKDLIVFLVKRNKKNKSEKLTDV